MRSNLWNFARMQLESLSHIVWLQLLGVLLYPVFFTQQNAQNDMANILTLATGFVMLAYLIIRNFAFNDARYKTPLLFGILPVLPKTVLAARWLVVYLFCFAAAMPLVLASHILHLLRPEWFAAIPVRILPFGLLLAAVLSNAACYKGCLRFYEAKLLP